MALVRGLTELDGIFPTASPDMVGADLKAGTTVAVQDGSQIQFYDVSITDSGSGVLLNNTLFANPVNGVIGTTWNLESSNFTIAMGGSYFIDGSTNTVDAALPAILTVGKEIIVHNDSSSTNKVQLLNPSFTIKGQAGEITAGTDLELEPGDTAHLVAKTSLILEVV